ncbi:hypothetical protein [Streptomyces sp. NPDC001034]|uniref:hypothetical protein n=1 Tax=Streptomyces sp. NPDC001034 TaxID=3154375 RepID=UPI0033246D7C
MRNLLTIAITSLIAAAVLPVALSGQAAAADTPWPSPGAKSVVTAGDTPWPGTGTGTAAVNGDTPWPVA